MSVVHAGAPLGAGRLAIVLVHGRNASPEKILTLMPGFARSDASYLAPAAPGGSWYPKGFMAPMAENEPGITDGIAAVHACIAQALAAGVPAERIVIGGFSQGACLAGTAVVHRPARYGAVLMFSGGLIGPPGTSWPAAGSLGGTPVFLGCSDVDGHIPADRVRESAAHFTQLGAEVDMRLYPGMGHLVSEDELVVARALLDRAAAG